MNTRTGSFGLRLSQRAIGRESDRVRAHRSGEREHGDRNRSDGETHCASPYAVGYAVRGLRASSAFRIWVSWPSGVFATPVPPVAGFSSPVMPHRRLPSRLPGPWTASTRSWIWFVRMTRPRTLRLIGPRSSERIEQALPAGSGGSGSGGIWLALAVPAAGAAA